MQRRTWLKLGAGSAAVLALAGVGAVLTTPRGFVDGRLSGPAREACAAIARGVLGERLPPDPQALRTALDAYLGRLEAAIANFPRAVQGEISELLTIIGTAPGRMALVGVSAPWPQANAAQVQGGLDAMRRSSLALKQQAYHALRDLTHGGYYAEPATWGDLGYPGPAPI